MAMGLPHDVEAAIYRLAARAAHKHLHLDKRVQWARQVDEATATKGAKEALITNERAINSWLTVEKSCTLPRELPPAYSGQASFWERPR